MRLHGSSWELFLEKTYIQFYASYIDWQWSTRSGSESWFYKDLNSLGPMYLQDLLSWYTPRWALQSCVKNLLIVPSLREIHLSLTGGQDFFWSSPWHGGTLCHITSVPHGIFHSLGLAKQRCSTRLLLEGSNCPKMVWHCPFSCVFPCSIFTSGKILWKLPSELL